MATNQEFEGSAISVVVTYPTAPDSGDMCRVGSICGVALTDENTTSLETVVEFSRDKTFNFSVTATGGAIAKGDKLYFHDASGINNVAAGGYFCAIAMAAIASGTATIEIKLEAPGGSSGDASYIVVSTTGSDTLGDGSYDNPYATLTKAMTKVSATRKTIYMLPGDYAEAALITWPSISGVRLVGLDGQGNVVISNANAAAEAILINPTVQTSSFEAFLENVCISHDAQIGIEINNTATAKKLLIHMKGVSFEAVSTGDSIHVTHTDAGNAIRMYLRDCDEIEGLVTFHGANNSDKFRAYNCVLTGGLTTSGAVTLEVMLQSCVVLASALTIGDATALLTYRACLYRTDADPSVYSELADGYQA